MIFDVRAAQGKAAVQNSAASTISREGPMYQGLGGDGAVMADVPAGDRLVTALLQAEQRDLDWSPEFEESAETSLWSPTPGVTVVLPERYTPTYAYPALIWLLEPGEDEESARRRLEDVSSRNYVGIGLRPELYGAGLTHAASAQRDDAPSPRRGLSCFANLMRCVESWVHLHPNRKYVAGTDSSARIAIAWMLACPDWFAGAIAVNSPREAACAWRTSSPAIERRRLLWVRTDYKVGTDDDPELLALSCLGLKTSTFYARGSSAADELARRIDRWVLEGLSTAVLG
ncbi:MAG: hypothetical protein KDA75_04975 [Planctomycetaceae bacterium]|nr:hypothetical protein [Planctomycetaceae bacterium]